MKLETQIREYVQACFTGIWIESFEPSEAIVSLGGLCQVEGWTLLTWDLERGIQPKLSGEDQPSNDPVSAVRQLARIPANDGTVLVVLRNLHRFVQSPELIQALEHQLAIGKQTRVILVVLAPCAKLPPELERQFVVIVHSLPDRDQLATIAAEVIGSEAELPVENERARLLDAAVGLTCAEAENAFSLSLVRSGKLEPDSVWEIKSQSLNKSGALQLHRGGQDFSSLGGLDSLKAFCRRAILRSTPDRHARGVLLLSPPGCGKSQFCRALGCEVGRPVLILDVGSLMGSLVGESEHRTRTALSIADAMAPCILMIDEVEKAFAGIGGKSDSGVSSRMFGTFLGWLNDHQTDVFVVCTANDVSQLPPEFARSERFDGVFFLDLPDSNEKNAIWELYLQQFDLDPRQARPSDDLWTGAEIKSCCRLASLLDVSLIHAGNNIVPVANSSGDSVSRLRAWASGRCLSASKPGIYRHMAKTRKTSRNIEPSNN